VKLYNKLLFFYSKWTTLNVWPKIVCPPKPATLSTAKKTCSKEKPMLYKKKNQTKKEVDAAKDLLNSQGNYPPEICRFPFTERHYSREFIKHTGELVTYT
jgi:hypothetical protein